MTQPAFTPVDRNTLHLLAEYNRAQRWNVAMGSITLSAEAATLGYLLDDLLQRGGATNGPHRTYYANSGIEAIGAAIKLCRHHAVRNKHPNDGSVLIVDPEHTIEPFFDPTNRGFARALVPGLVFVESTIQATLQLKQRNWAGIIIPHRDCESLGEAESVIQNLRKRKGLQLVVSYLGESPGETYFQQRAKGADAHIFGEELAARQLPFGCLTMSSRAQAVWNNLEDAKSQTSTFGGTAVSLRVVLNTLRSAGLWSTENERSARLIEQSITSRLGAFHDFVNPAIARLYDATGMVMDIERAHAGRLIRVDGTDIIDCCSGIGSNLRGHNPDDLVENVFEKHRPDVDYHSQLQQKLQDLTGYEHVVPAVSGATAVDLAVTFAALARPSRPTIVVFRGNFSGKTPISLSLSKHAPLMRESTKEAFRPYYSNLEYVDLDDADCEIKLIALLKRPDVGLVWMELIHGTLCWDVPDRIIEIVLEHKHSCGYLVGVDEVLTGGWRSGRGFLAQEKFGRRFDVSSMAKPLSDMTVPFGAALVAGDIYASARMSNPELVDSLSGYYRSDLAAHIALNALDDCTRPERLDEAARCQDLLRVGLRDIATRSKIVSAVPGEGGLTRLALARRWFPFHPRSPLGLALDMALSDILTNEYGVYTAMSRFMHRTFAEESDIDEILARLEKGLTELTPGHVYALGLRSLARYFIRGPHFKRGWS